jgi:hypothetical protein
LALTPWGVAGKVRRFCEGQIMRRKCYAVIAALLLVGADKPKAAPVSLDIRIADNMMEVRIKNVLGVARRIQFSSEGSKLLLEGDTNVDAKIYRTSATGMSEVMKAEKIIFNLADGSIRTTKSEVFPELIAR